MNIEKVTGFKAVDGSIHTTEKSAIQSNVMQGLLLDFGFSSEGKALSRSLCQRDVDALQFIVANHGRLAFHFKDYPL